MTQQEFDAIRARCEAAQEEITDIGAPRVLWISIEDIPALLDELARLQAENKSLEGYRTAHYEDLPAIGGYHGW